MCCELLTRLGDGKFHSNQSLEKSLQGTLVTLQEAIDQLCNMGLEIQDIKGKGYRLASTFCLFNKNTIFSGLDDKFQKDTLLHVDWITTSTNDRAKELALKAPTKKIVCLAEYQQLGRGRRGHVWKNPLGATISMSVGQLLPKGISSLSGLSLVVGLAVIRALSLLGPHKLKLKWPNDIVYPLKQGYKKLGGILIESSYMATQSYLVIGLGLNTSLSLKQKAQIDQPITDLEQVFGIPVDRNQVVSYFINQLYPMLDKFFAYGFAPFKQQWHEVDGFLDKPVTLCLDSEKLTGIVRGVNDQGELLLQTENILNSLYRGVISLRSTNLCVF